MAETLRQTTFRSVDLNDPFFDSLKAQYSEFSDWFCRKATSGESVYVVDADAGPGIRGFVYLKVEEGEITDVSPALPSAKRLKVGTLKVVARGTKLGERIIKRIFDRSIEEHVEEIYVTVFDTHSTLIELFARYGFKQKGSKTTPNGVELVLLRNLREHSDSLLEGYPFLRTRGVSKWLLAIYPEHHTGLFADSILKTEDPEIVKDEPHSNTIHKVYVAKLSLTRMKPRDLVVIYRTSDILGRARFRSVASSICVVEETKSKKDFRSLDHFLEYTERHSVFSRSELTGMYTSGKNVYTVRMTYNVAFRKRPNRDKLLDRVGLPESPRWDLIRVSDRQFSQIMELGEVDEGLVVN